MATVLSPYIALNSMPASDDAVGIFLGTSPQEVAVLAGYRGLWDGMRGSKPPRPQPLSQSHNSIASLAKMATMRFGSVDSGNQSSTLGMENLLLNAERHHGTLNVQKHASSCFASKDGVQSTRCPKAKKRVTFADSHGFELEAIKVIHEDSDTPPVLNPLLPLATTFVRTTAECMPFYRADFCQPVSNYALFRERLATRCVAVENIAVHTTCAVMTVKVRNLSFEKRVFARVTLDGWRSYRDFMAHYLDKGSDDSCNALGQGSDCDTFCLEFDIASDFAGGKQLKTVELAVCYEYDGQQFWDNNGGDNYRLIPEYCLQKPGNSLSTRVELPSADWSNYAAWRVVDTDIPYW